MKPPGRHLYFSPRLARLLTSEERRWIDAIVDGALRREERPSVVGSVGIEILDSLRDRPDGMTVKELSIDIGTRIQGILNALRRLEASGLVQRAGTQRYRIRYVLTDAGRARVETDPRVRRRR